MHSLRSLVVKVLTPQSKARILYWYLSVKRIILRKRLIQTNYVCSAIGTPDRHCFFGYYDISPFNQKNEVIFLQLDKILNKAEIVLHDREKNNCRIVTTTSAWNWQQGSRLRWYPKTEDTIVFNDFKNGRYIARKLNIKTGQEEVINTPLYDIDCNGKYGITLDFERLGVKRPGYGYTCQPYQEPQNLKGEGVDLVNFAKGTTERIVTYSDIADVLQLKRNDFRNNYINHLSFTPSGERFMFFWLTVVENFHQAFLLVYDLKSKQIKPLETEGKVSHYLWLDEDHLLCTVYNKKQECRYVIYGLDGSKCHVFKAIDYDGHPIWYKDGLILTDSYPDRNGYQRLVVCNLETDETKQILETFQKPAISVERRTDLHPRYDAATDTICIDASPKGTRKFLLITNK